MNRAIPRLVQTLLVALLSSQFTFAQSTTGWIPANSDNPGPQGQRNDSYISIKLLAISVYSKSNWWTSAVEKNKSAVGVVELSGSTDGVARNIEDKRVSEPRSMTGNGTSVDFGWTQQLLWTFPTTFSSLQVSVSVQKTSSDKVDELMKAASELSASAPLLSLSTAAIGNASAAKSLLDIIFSKRLVSERLRSTETLTTGGGGLLAPGIYVVLAGDKPQDYETYTSDLSHLKWNGSFLTWNDKPLDRISYFVIQVGYTPRLFGDARGDRLVNMALGVPKPWVLLYRKAQNQASSFLDLKLKDSVRDSVAIVKSDADSLLDEDTEIVHGERDEIKKELSRDLNERLKARISHLQGAAGLSNSTPQIFRPIE